MPEIKQFKLKRKPILGDGSHEMSLAEHIASAHPHPNYRPDTGSDGTGDLSFDSSFFTNTSGMISLRVTPSAAYDSSGDNTVVTVKNIRNIAVDVKSQVSADLPGLVNDAVTSAVGDRFVEKTKIDGNYIDNGTILLADGNGNCASSNLSIDALIAEIGVDKVWTILQQRGIYPNTVYDNRVHETYKDDNDIDRYYNLDFNESYNQKLSYVVYGDGTDSGQWLNAPSNKSGFLDVKSVYTLGEMLSIKNGSTVEYIPAQGSNPAQIKVTDPQTSDVTDIFGLSGVIIENNAPVIKRELIAMQVFDSDEIRKKRMIKVEFTYDYSSSERKWNKVITPGEWQTISVSNP